MKRSVRDVANIGVDDLMNSLASSDAIDERQEGGRPTVAIVQMLPSSRLVSTN